MIDPATGKPSLKRRRASKPATAALALEEALKERMPERTLLEILARTAYWLEWWRRFGPASGSDPKLAGPLLRYVLTTFTYGANLGPAQAARHIRGVSAHELGLTAARHFTTGKLNLGRARTSSTPICCSTWSRRGVTAPASRRTGRRSTR